MFDLAIDRPQDKQGVTVAIESQEPAVGHEGEVGEAPGEVVLGHDPAAFRVDDREAAASAIGGVERMLRRAKSPARRAVGSETRSPSSWYPEEYRPPRPGRRRPAISSVIDFDFNLVASIFRLLQTVPIDRAVTSRPTSRLPRGSRGPCPVRPAFLHGLSTEPGKGHLGEPWRLTSGSP